MAVTRPSDALLAHPEQLDIAASSLEPYPQLNQVQQDEAIALLLGVVKKLDLRVAALEKK